MGSGFSFSHSCQLILFIPYCTQGCAFKEMRRPSASANNYLFKNLSSLAPCLYISHTSF